MCNLMKNKKIYLVLLLALVLLLLTACQGEKTDTPSESATSAPAYTKAEFFDYIVNVDGGAEITGYSGNEAAVLIPDQIDGHPVVAVQEKAFYGNQLIGRLVLPDTVTRIDNEAFRGCSKLKEIFLSDTLTEIGESAFAETPALKDIKWPSGEFMIRFGAFARSGLESVTIPKGATHNAISETYYETSWFQGCYNLRTVVYEDGTDCVCLGDFTGYHADNGVMNIDSMTIPASVTKIMYVNDGKNPNGLFNAELKQVVVADGSYAFQFFTEAKSQKLFNIRRDFSSGADDVFRPFDGEIVIMSGNNE